MLYAFFWVIPQGMKFICRCFRTLCLFHVHRQVGACRIHTPTCLWRWNRQSVPKHQHINFRHWGITQKKAYNIQNTAKVWNQERICLYLMFMQVVLFLWCWVHEFWFTLFINLGMSSIFVLKISTFMWFLMKSWSTVQEILSIWSQWRRSDDTMKYWHGCHL